MKMCLLSRFRFYQFFFHKITVCWMFFTNIYTWQCKTCPTNYSQTCV